MEAVDSVSHVLGVLLAGMYFQPLNGKGSKRLIAKPNSSLYSCCSPTGQCTNDCGSPGNSTVSTDGSCGPNNGFRTCPGSGFGDCCSSKSVPMHASHLSKPSYTSFL